MDSITLQGWMNNPKQITEDDFIKMQELVELYPYSQSLRLVYLLSLFYLHKSNFQQELKHAALYISDRKILFNLLENIEQQPKVSDTVTPVSEELNQLDLEVDSSDGSVEEDRTKDVINSFLSTLPEECCTDYTGLEISSDYMGYLFENDAALNAESIPMEGQNLIDGFLNRDREKAELNSDEKLPISVDVDSNEVPTSSIEADDDGLFTETLAKIYIKQKRYSKALEILKKLSLKYPNKNTYFVDQIRFLEKVIINAKSK